jgi:hypothetical protein
MKIGIIALRFVLGVSATFSSNEGHQVIGTGVYALRVDW